MIADCVCKQYIADQSENREFDVPLRKISRCCHYLLRPGSLDELGVDDLCPSLLTLDVAPVAEVSRDAVPSQTVAQLLGVAHQLLQ